MSGHVFKLFITGELSRTKNTKSFRALLWLRDLVDMEYTVKTKVVGRNDDKDLV